ncbi:hypothetical protein [Helicobacter sp. T3_23-1056]
MSNKEERENMYFKGILLLCAMFGFVEAYAQKVQNIDKDTINDADIDKVLHALIFGVDCSGGEIAEQKALPKGVINASNNATIDSAKYQDAKSKAIAFNGKILHGGIFDSTQSDNTQNLYMSADRKISYTLKGVDFYAPDTQGKSNAIKGTLEVKSICEKQGFTLSNFTNGDFGINLSKHPRKEIAIALNVNKSMSRYIDALIDIAPFLSKHILGESGKENSEKNSEKNSDENSQNNPSNDRGFAKISLITFSYSRVADLGTFYDGSSLTSALYRAKGIDSKDNIVNIALIEAMKNFTKDNGLKKEIYLITNGSLDDPHKEEQMLSMTKNLNANIVKNTKTNADNRVKIHIFAITPFASRKSQKANIEFLQNLAKTTGGSYNEANNPYDFKKQILTLSNDGKTFDMREIDDKIRPSKTHKIYDPDNPNDNAPKHKYK